MELKELTDFINAINNGKNNQKKESQEKITELGRQIIVLHRGWVCCGTVKITGDMVEVEDAKVIRRWGRPLAELATIGKNDNTIIEKSCKERFPLLGVIKFMEIKEGVLL